MGGRSMAIDLIVIYEWLSGIKLRVPKRDTVSQHRLVVECKVDSGYMFV